MRLLIEADNTSVGIENGRIIESSGTFDHVVCSTGEVRPGLINAHDHLHRNHYGRLGAPPYANAGEWAQDIQSRFADTIAQGRVMSRRPALLVGAWKNLLSGVTHVVHHDSWEPDFADSFPIKVVRIPSADSIVHDPQFAPPIDAPYALHVAEGVDDIAAAEISAIDARGLLNRHLLAVHAVGADQEGVARLRACGCAIVWCPTSNQFLFGRSLPSALLEGDVDVLLGSDSLLTSAGTILDELRAARTKLSEQRLVRAVGELAADRLGLAAPSLEPGAPADLVLFRRPLPEADVEDVLLVAVDGILRVLDPELVMPLGVEGGQLITWRGVTRWISESAALAGPLERSRRKMLPPVSAR
jgi:cytosine/adenosine deaminase-related metal-dependent hydrolase